MPPGSALLSNQLGQAWTNLLYHTQTRGANLMQFSSNELYMLLNTHPTDRPL